MQTQIYRDNSNSSAKNANVKTASTANSLAHEQNPVNNNKRIAIGAVDAVTKKLEKEKDKTRKLIVEHHYTLPTSYKHKKRYTDHRKNATLERSSTKKNTVEQLVNEATTAQQQTKTNIESSKMHYHNPNDMPKYLFGERSKQHHFSNKPMKSDEIFLNKSGWVQVNQRDHYGNRDNNGSSFHKYTNNLVQNNNNNGSKLEALITRSEIRKVKATIDPQLSAMLSERPGFLPIKRFDDNESPPPITPIISPPPAFQDSKSTKLTSANGSDENINVNKGMVFSRSFEYDNRKPYEYDQTFSKSFDYDFLSPTKEEAAKVEKENTFPNLTGVSPNYLSKPKPAPNQNVRDNPVAYQQYLEPKEYIESARKQRVRSAFLARAEIVEQQASRSRRGQFNKQDSTSSSGSQAGFRSAHQSTISKRLNSCDSGARSGMEKYQTF